MSKTWKPTWIPWRVMFVCSLGSPKPESWRTHQPSERSGSGAGSRSCLCHCCYCFTMIFLRLIPMDPTHKGSKPIPLFLKLNAPFFSRIHVIHPAMPRHPQHPRGKRNQAPLSWYPLKTKEPILCCGSTAGVFLPYACMQLPTSASLRSHLASYRPARTECTPAKP